MAQGVVPLFSLTEIPTEEAGGGVIQLQSDSWLKFPSSTCYLIVLNANVKGCSRLALGPIHVSDVIKGDTGGIL